jgi:hypothetical protein
VTDVRRAASYALFAALPVISLGDAARAQPVVPKDYEVKAVYLYNFGRFITWPRSIDTNDVFTVCVLGRDPFGRALDTTLAGEQIGGRALAARRLTRPQDAAGCRILFVSESEESQLERIFDRIDRAGILTVSDMPRFVARGGMIQFIAQGSKIRFEVNLAAAEGAGLMLSSELLRVAAAVRRNEPGT